MARSAKAPRSALSLTSAGLRRASSSVTGFGPDHRAEEESRVLHFLPRLIAPLHVRLRVRVVLVARRVVVPRGRQDLRALRHLQRLLEQVVGLPVEVVAAAPTGWPSRCRPAARACSPTPCRADACAGRGRRRSCPAGTRPRRAPTCPASPAGSVKRRVVERARPHFARRRILREDEADLRAIGRRLAVRRVVHLELEDAARLEAQRRPRPEDLRIRARRIRGDQARRHALLALRRAIAEDRPRQALPLRC